jgi:regulatory protein
VSGRRHKNPLEDPAAVHGAAVALLAKRDFASAELRSRLAAEGFDSAAIVAVVARLIDERIVDDARFATNYVAFHAGRGQGPLRVGADLKGLGVPDGLIDETLRAGPDWSALASQVRARRFGSRSPRSRTELARQARFLQYRGFSSDHIRSALGTLFEPDE